MLFSYGVWEQIAILWSIKGSVMRLNFQLTNNCLFAPFMQRNYIGKFHFFILFLFWLFLICDFFRLDFNDSPRSLLRSESYHDTNRTTLITTV